LLLWGGIFDIPEKRIQVEQDEKQTADPNFWNDSERAEGIMRKIKRNKVWVKQFDDLNEKIDDLEVLDEFQRAGEGTEAEVDAAYDKILDRVENIEFRSTLDQEEDELSCVLEINAGAGGTEANDWAGMLFRMYQMHAESQDFKINTLSYNEGDAVGIKSAQLEITGDYAYGLLKSENGVHRLVRVSPFNAQGKRMTSFASVFVHPMVDDSIEIEINPADLSWDTFRASGAGGQHVNKTESAVRVTHQPTGVVVECQEQRSQHKNRDKAMQMLRSRLYELELEKQRAERDKLEDGKMANEWGSQIRSYVLDDRRVKDHRTNFETRQPEKVLDGDLEGFVKEYLLWASGKKAKV